MSIYIYDFQIYAQKLRNEFVYIEQNFYLIFKIKLFINVIYIPRSHYNDRVALSHY